MLRIIGGEYRHRTIDVPPGTSTRPTTDKVREAVMSAIAYDIRDAVVLDLFAGSGALGLEALSRGAKRIYFCDKAPGAYQTIRKNIKKLDAEEYCEVYRMHYASYLEDLHRRSIVFDIVFLDPPYAMKDVYSEIAEYLLNCGMLSERGVLIREWNSEIQENPRFPKHRLYRYGTVNVMIERR